MGRYAALRRDIELSQRHRRHRDRLVGARVRWSSHVSASNPREGRATEVMNIVLPSISKDVLEGIYQFETGAE